MTAKRHTDTDARDLLDHLSEVRTQRGTVTVSCRYQCHSGDTFSGEWCGVRLGDLLDRAAPGTTHVRAVSEDGYYALIPVIDALDAVVATDRSDADPVGLPRVVGDALESSWTVRRLARLEPVALPADAAPDPGYLTADDSTADQSTDTSGRRRSVDQASN